MKLKDCHVGIPMIGSRDWLGGISYIELLVKAVTTLPKNERPQLYFIVEDGNLAALELHRYFLHLFDGIILIGTEKQIIEIENKQSLIRCDYFDEIFDIIDFYFPVTSNVLPGVCSASWIPDFQHCYLPELFSEQEVKFRNNQHNKIARLSRLVVLSSHDAEKDFRQLYPQSKAITKVLSFHGMTKSKWLEPNPSEVQKRYCLPDRFLLCCNQFWAHKNHRRLFEAIAYLRQQGEDVCLVCTGSIDDHRQPGYFDELKQYMEGLNITNYVHILGIIPRSDQIQLIRRSLAVIQPSLFEGWSTVVEDCRMLGKDIILSDLDVNVEQNPDYATYFDRNDSTDLGKKILNLLPFLEPGPIKEREVSATQKADKYVNSFAYKFCDIVSTSQSVFNLKEETANKIGILVVYDPKGTDIDSSQTYKSILAQTHENMNVHIGTLADLDFEAMQEDFIYFIEEGYFLKKNFFKHMLNAIKDNDYVVCGLKRLLNNERQFYKDFYPINNFDGEVCFNEFNKQCILYRRKSFTKDEILNYVFQNKKMKVLGLSLVEISLSDYLNKKLSPYRNKKIYIYGAGSHTKVLLENVVLKEYNICGIIDKNEELSGKNLIGYKIYSYELIKNEDIDTLIISSVSYEKQIFDDLKEFFSENNLVRLHYSN